MNKRYLVENLEEWIMEQKYQEYSTNTLKQYKANVLIYIFLLWFILKLEFIVV